MSTAAIAGKGVKLKVGDGASPEVFTAIAEILSINLPEKSVSLKDVTNLDSPNNMREFISTFVDPGEVSVTMNLLPGNATQSALETALDGGTVKTYRIVFKAGSNGTLQFDGIVQRYGGGTVDTEGQVTTGASVKITGDWTWTTDA